MNHTVAHDMTRKLQASLADVLQREMRIAEHVCGFAEIGLMMIEASVMMARTTAGTIANSIDDDAKVEGIIKMTIDGIVEQIRKSEPDIAAKVLAKRRSRAA